MPKITTPSKNSLHFNAIFEESIKAIEDYQHEMLQVILTTVTAAAELSLDSLAIFGLYNETLANAIQASSDERAIIFKQDTHNFDTDTSSNQAMIKVLNTLPHKLRSTIGNALLKYQAADRCIMSLKRIPSFTRLTFTLEHQPYNHKRAWFKGEIDKLIPIISKDRTPWCERLLNFLAARGYTRLAQWFAAKSSPGGRLSALLVQQANLVPPEPMQPRLPSTTPNSSPFKIKPTLRRKLYAP